MNPGTRACAGNAALETEPGDALPLAFPRQARGMAGAAPTPLSLGRSRGGMGRSSSARRSDFGPRVHAGGTRGYERHRWLPHAKAGDPDLREQAAPLPVTRRPSRLLLGPRRPSAYGTCIRQSPPPVLRGRIRRRHRAHAPVAAPFTGVRRRLSPAGGISNLQAAACEAGRQDAAPRSAKRTPPDGAPLRARMAHHTGDREGGDCLFVVPGETGGAMMKGFAARQARVRKRACRAGRCA